MVRSVISVSFAHLACAAIASAAFLGVSIKTDDALNIAARAALADAGVEDADTAIVVRVYAAFDGPGDGTANTVVSTSFVDIRPGRPNVIFYQDQVGSALPPNDALFPQAPSLEYDSFGTIGGATISESPAVLTRPFAAEGILQYEGGWFNGNPPNHAGAASVDLGDGTWGTLLFQFTMLGDESEACMTEVPGTLLTGTLTVFTQGQGQAIEDLGGGLGAYCTGELIDVEGAPFSIVNGFDLAYMLSQWGPAIECETRSDLNNDGIVDGADLAILLANWGCTP